MSITMSCPGDNVSLTLQVSQQPSLYISSKLVIITYKPRPQASPQMNSYDYWKITSFIFS